MTCPDCGGNCDPECGLHPLGCIYGGFTKRTSYWLIAEGCELEHPAPEPPLHMLEMPVVEPPEQA